MRLPDHSVQRDHLNRARDLAHCDPDRRDPAPRDLGSCRHPGLCHARDLGLDPGLGPGLGPGPDPDPRAARPQSARRLRDGASNDAESHSWELPRQRLPARQ